MGRHTEPGTGTPTPDRGFWVRAGVLAVVAVLVATYLLTRGGGDDVTTASPEASSTASSSVSESPAAQSESPAPSESASPPESSGPSESSAAAERPPTLTFRVLRESFITIRVPGGRTLESRVFRKGEKGSYDQKRLQVVNGRPSAVRFTVNGKERKPGPAAEPETFTAKRP